ncbi:hypothetical protein AAG906_000992 [Vitis piasezkii]
MSFFLAKLSVQSLYGIRRSSSLTSIAILLCTMSSTPHFVSGDSNPSSDLPLRVTFTSILFGYDLMGYLDGTLPCPPTPTEKSSPSALARYAHWYRQDHLLLNAIFSSVSKTVMPLIAMTTMSRDA